jgi:hypothetical protein
VLHLLTVAAGDFDCIAVRHGRDVVLCVDETLLTARGAVSINHALRHLAAATEPDQSSTTDGRS